MLTKEYKRLSKKELLELLILESERAEELERKLQLANEQLSSRELKINNAGSIAEAALALSGIFEAAEAACSQYIENIKLMNIKQEEIYMKCQEESKQKAEVIVNEANLLAYNIEAETRLRCAEIIAQTDEKSESVQEEN